MNKPSGNGGGTKPNTNRRVSDRRFSNSDNQHADDNKRIRVTPRQVSPDDLMPPGAAQLLTQCYLCNVTLPNTGRHILMNARTEQGKLGLEIYGFCQTCVIKRRYEVEAVAKQMHKPSMGVFAQRLEKVH